MSFLDRIFGSYSEKELAKIEPIKKKVLDLDVLREVFRRLDLVAPLRFALEKTLHIIPLMQDTDDLIDGF